MEQLAERLQASLAALLADPVLPTAIAAGGTGMVVLAILALLLSARRRRSETVAADNLRAELRLARDLMGAELAELKGRISTIADISSRRETELGATLDQRLDHVSDRLGQSLDKVTERLAASLADTGNRLGQNLSDQGARTTDGLSRLYERLAVIDTAQANLTELSSQVVSLKDVLGNKQARGAFGQLRMEAIIEDGLPRGAFEFQATLSNGKRPDCLVRLPSAPAPLVIDAKFPLEGFEALRLARTAEETQGAMQRVRTAVAGHIDDIAGKYLIAGETQDMALMFVPSEQVYAELHERFPDVLQRAHRARVVIVSPNMLMLAVQTMQAIFKDVRMREQAGLIQREVGLLMGDVTRLAERARELERHFMLAAKDVEKILASSERIANRGKRIEGVDLAEVPESKAAAE